MYNTEPPHTCDKIHSANQSKQHHSWQQLHGTVTKMADDLIVYVWQLLLLFDEVHINCRFLEIHECAGVLI